MNQLETLPETLSETMPETMSESMSESMSETTFDVEAVRRDFPILQQSVNGHPLVYLDNAATTQKPNRVIDAISHYYRHDNANVHRGAHALSDRATLAFEGARASVQQFINAPSQDQIIWTRGCTEAINLVAQCFAAKRFQPGDEILVSGMAHHANIVPWQMAAEACGARVIPIPVTDASELDMEGFKQLLGPRTRLVALEHVSNAMGTINPVAEIIALAHEAGAQVLVDGAQAIAH